MSTSLLNSFFTHYVLPQVRVELGHFRSDDRDDWQKNDAYTGFSPFVCELLVSLRPLSRSWNKIVLDSIRSLWLENYRGPAPQVVADAMCTKKKKRHHANNSASVFDAEPKERVLFSWKGGAYDQGSSTVGSLTVTVQTEPPRNDRQIAERLAKHIFECDPEWEDPEDEGNNQRFDYKQLEREKAGNSADTGDDVDEMVISRIICDGGVDYTLGMIENEDQYVEYFQRLHGLPKVWWKKGRNFVSTKTALFSSSWPLHDQYVKHIRQFILSQTQVGDMLNVDEGFDTFTYATRPEEEWPGNNIHTFRTIKLILVALEVVVCVHSLTGRPDLNGQFGVVESPLGVNGRLGVRMGGGPTESKIVAIKPANLTAAHATTPEELLSLSSGSEETPHREWTVERMAYNTKYQCSAAYQYSLYIPFNVASTATSAANISTTSSTAETPPVHWIKVCASLKDWGAK